MPTVPARLSSSCVSTFRKCTFTARTRVAVNCCGFQAACCSCLFKGWLLPASCLPGTSKPTSPPPSEPTPPAKLFQPRQILLDLALTALLFIGLGCVAFFVPVQLGPPTNRADAQFIPRPEWYYLPIFQWLKYWHGAVSVLGVLVIPTIPGLAVVALLFLEPGIKRRPWKWPIARGAYAFVMLGLVGLGLRSKYLDHHDTEVAQQLAKQDTEEITHMSNPLEPELSAASLAVKVARADALAAKGKAIFEAHSSNPCHGDGGIGTDGGPTLIGVGAKFSTDKLTELLLHPTAKLKAGGTPTPDLSPDDRKALVAYVSSLK
jgi:ubiquinol-cytochrome c reductase cytochrome b subunit